MIIIVRDDLQTHALKSKPQWIITQLLFFFIITISLRIGAYVYIGLPTNGWLINYNFHKALNMVPSDFVAKQYSE